MSSKRKKNDGNNDTKRAKQLKTLPEYNLENLTSSSENLDDLERVYESMEKEKVDIKEDKKKELSWPEEDIHELLRKIEENIPQNDALSYSTRLEKIDWSNIIFKNYTIEECKKTWFFIQKHIRRFRLLNELISDAKDWLSKPQNLKGRFRHPDLPRKPLSAYLLFYLKKKNKVASQNPGLEATELTKLMGQMYRNLTQEKKEKYERLAEKSKEEYQEKMKQFLSSHPDYANKSTVNDKEKNDKNKQDKPPKKCQTPFGLFYDSELKKTNGDVDKSNFKDICKEQWKHMSDKKKLVWIKLAEESQTKYEEELKTYMEKHPEYEPKIVKPVITKEETKLKERAAGKPAKPPCSAYGLYSKVMLSSEEIKKINPRERMNYIAIKWKNCSEEEKGSYRERAAKLMEKYKLEYASYLESLPEEQRQLETNTKSKKSKPVNPTKKTNQNVATKKVQAAKSIVREPEVVAKRKFNDPQQPPVSPVKYFASIYKGDKDPVEAWREMTSAERQKYKDELTEKKRIYIKEFERFLKSLSKTELEEYCAMKQENKDDDVESSECSSSSDEGTYCEDEDDHSDSDE